MMLQIQETPEVAESSSSSDYNVTLQQQQNALRHVRFSVAKEKRIVPLTFERGTLRVGADVTMQSAQELGTWLQRHSNVRRVEIVAMGEAEIQNHLRKLRAAMHEDRLSSVEAKIVDGVLQVAVGGGNDLFLIPDNGVVRMVGEINGGERVIGTLAKEEYENDFMATTVARALGNTADFNVSQIAHYQAEMDGVAVSCRLRTLPRTQEEGDGRRRVSQPPIINLRVHPSGEDLPEPEDLGIRPEAIEAFTRVVDKEGLAVIVTGQPGSGKTTTIYVILRSLNSYRIYTFEKSIEVLVAPLNQREYKDTRDIINDREAVLQMSPKAVFMGEALGPEDFKPLMQFMESGVPTLSNFHEKTAIGALRRGIRMSEGDRFLSKVGLIWCQALVSRVCMTCATPSEPSGAVAYRFQKHEREAPKQTWKRNPGRIFKTVKDGVVIEKLCDACGGIGALGPRRPLVEFIYVSEALRKQINETSRWSAPELLGVAYTDHKTQTIAAQGAVMLAAGDIDETDFLKLGDDLIG